MREGLLTALLLMPVAVACAAALTPAREAELRDMVHQDCGSCHGLRLTGGLGPPLTREALADRPLELLTATISEGRAGTPMPPWKPLLNPVEIDWIARYLKNGGGAP